MAAVSSRLAWQFLFDEVDEYVRYDVSRRTTFNTKEVHMSKSYTILGLILVAVLALAACTAAPQPAEAPTADEQMEDAPADMSGKVVIPAGGTIRIGGSFALTGPIPDPGKDIQYGAEIAIDDLNAMGGFEGFMFETGR